MGEAAHQQRWRGAHHTVAKWHAGCRFALATACAGCHHVRCVFSVPCNSYKTQQVHRSTVQVLPTGNGATQTLRPALPRSQRFYLVLDPLSPPGHKARLVVVPKKRLPAQAGDKRGRERFYGFVEATAPRAASDAGGAGGGTAEAEGEGEAKGAAVAGERAGKGEGAEAGGGEAGGLVGVKALVARLGAEEYETKTRGTRHRARRGCWPRRPT